MHLVKALGLPLSLAILTAPGLAQEVPPPPSERMLAERAAIASLAVLDGEWRGEGWALVDGQRQPRIVTMRVGPTLGGALRVLEQRTYGPGGALLFRSFNNVAYDVDEQAYVMQARAEGRFGQFPFIRTDTGPTTTGYVWQIGPVLRYTGTLADGQWTEVTEALAADGSAQEIARFTLTHIGETTWPHGGGLLAQP